MFDAVRNDFIKKNINKKHKVLIEWYRYGKWLGWTENYIRVGLVGNYKRWQLVEIVLDDDSLYFG